MLSSMRTRSSARLSVARRPFHIPTELLEEIVSYCDQPTLAAVAGVSFLCLELTGRLLYEDITLNDATAIIRLVERTVPPIKTDQSRLDSAALNRISPHTSLAQIHSATIFLPGRKFDRDCPSLSSSAALGLDLPVLSICLPLPNHLDDNPIFVSGFLPFFRCTTLILQGPLHHLPASSTSTSTLPLSSSPFVGLGSLPGEIGSPNFYPTIRLQGSFPSGPPKTVILSKTQLYSYRPLVRPPPLKSARILVDYLDEDETNESDRQCLTHAFVDMCNEMRDRLEPKHGGSLTYWPEYEVRAWVGSEETKRAVWEGLEDDEEQAPHDEDPVFVDAVSTRLRRFREEMVRGVKKGMDWEVLDEM